MKRVDHKKTYRALYSASARDIAIVDVPSLRFLMIDGQGDPNTSAAYAEAVEALFAVSYAAKFMVKKGPLAIDYKVMPLEGLWWADDMSAFDLGDKSSWTWTMMIMQPDVADDEVLVRAAAQVRDKKGLGAVDDLRLDVVTEGRCAQVLHVGPFSEEGPTVERLHAFVDQHSGRRGTHHEIYLSDIRRAAPENWKTIIRQPMT